MYKTIFFYKLDIKLMMRNKYICEGNFFEIFDKILNAPDVIKNTDELLGEYSTIVLKDKKIIIDILHHNRNFLFGSIGNIKEKLDLARIRNLKNLSHVQLKLNAENALEAYTYFLLDYQSGIIAFINSKSAPSIKHLGSIIEQHDVNYEAHIFPIRNKNVEGIINNVKKYGAIEIKVAQPPAEILGKNGENVSQKLLKKISEQGFQKFSIRFETDKDFKCDNNFLNSLVSEAYKYAKSNGHFEKIYITANVGDEIRQQTINLLELYFTKNVNLSIDENFSEKDIHSMLQDVYNKLKDELLKNIVLHKERDD